MNRKIIAIVTALLVCVSGFSLAAAAENAAPPSAPEGAGTGTPPEGEPPDMPEGGTPPDMPTGGQPGTGGPDGFGGSGAVTQGTAANTIDADAEVSGETYTSAGDNENALRITGDVTVSLDGITVEKTAGSTDNTEDSDFYGQNAGLLATDGASVSIMGGAITTATDGGNAVFSYGEGTEISIVGSVIRTSKSHAGGIHIAGGGTLYAQDLDIRTEGSSAAAIRSDRGGGTMTVDGGTYVTNGTGSPAIYSTATVSVSNATLEANQSEAVVVEGKHSVSLSDSDLTSSMSGNFLSDIKDTTHAIMIYQSMSGDADVGQSSFDMAGGSITADADDLFYITNTACTVSLSDVTLNLAGDTLLRVAGNNGARGWGTAGSNGGVCTFTADGQAMEGVILVDEASALTLALQNGTAFTGTINPQGQAGTVSVTLAEGSTWTLTADAYITSFEGDTAGIAAGDYHLYVDGEQVI